MAPKKGKQQQQARSTAAGKAAAAAAAAAAASSSSSSKVPTPFSKPDERLQPFLDGLDVTHLYITHIDRHPRSLKRNIFVVPILLNIVVLVLLAWRLKYIAPYYYALALTFLGRDSPTNIDTATAPWNELIDAIFNRTGVLMLDFAIFRFLAPWPYEFFVGDKSPSFWRTAVGFRDEEIVVRRSRRWDQTLPEGWLLKQEDDGSEGAAVWRERIMPAIDKAWIRAKTGYLMMDKSWDLDFLAMTVASNMVVAGQNEQRDFEKTLIVYAGQPHGWLVWPVWTLDEGVDEHRREKIVLFKDKLTAMGKENLFFRWIEIVQYESTQPGGFTPERQKAAMEKAREAFEAQGVDFEKFWDEVGGQEGLPGYT